MMNEHPLILTELNTALTATPPSISQTPKVSSFTPWPISPQSTESPASLDRPIGAIFECLIGSKRPVYTSQLQYSVKVATSSYTVQSKYMLVYPGSYM